MNGNGLGPWLSVVSYSESLISTAGAVLIGQTARVIGLDRALSKMLAPRRARWARCQDGLDFLRAFLPQGPD